MLADLIGPSGGWPCRLRSGLSKPWGPGPAGQHKKRTGLLLELTTRAWHRVSVLTLFLVHTLTTVNQGCTLGSLMDRTVQLSNVAGDRPIK